MSTDYIVTARTDVGNIKKINQDSLLVKVANSKHGKVAFAVACDGMGGLSQGEVASAHVILAFDKWFKDTLPLLLSQGISPDSIRQSQLELIRKCNEEIVNYGKNVIKANLGTTLTSMLIIGGNYYISHVGDCRAYELTNGNLTQLTKDQTFIAREIEMGRMTPEQARTDSRRNVLLQCVGVNDYIEPDFIVGQVKDKAAYLLCSDGFRHEISGGEIYNACYADIEGNIYPSKEAKRARMDANLGALIERVKSRNEKDNISAILLMEV